MVISQTVFFKALLNARLRLKITFAQNFKSEYLGVQAVRCWAYVWMVKSTDSAIKILSCLKITWDCLSIYTKKLKTVLLYVACSSKTSNYYIQIHTAIYASVKMWVRWVCLLHLSVLSTLTEEASDRYCSAVRDSSAFDVSIL